MAAGGIAYYFAKRDINAHRREQELKGIRGTEYLECTSHITPFFLLRNLLEAIQAASSRKCLTDLGKSLTV